MNISTKSNEIVVIFAKRERRFLYFSTLYQLVLSLCKKYQRKYVMNTHIIFGEMLIS